MAKKPAAPENVPPATASTAGAAGAAGADGGDAAPKSRKKLWLMLGAMVALVGLGVGGWLFWQNRQADARKAVATPPPPPLIYLALEPPFVANFEDGQNARFLQVDVRIASRVPETIALVRDNEPLIRNDLLMLYGAQDAGRLATRDGKDRLRADSLATVRRIVRSLGGKPESVEAVLFASFVMQ